MDWPENWIGNRISYRSYIRSLYFQPTVAFKVNEQFAIGVGLDIVRSQVNLKRKVLFAISPFLPSLLIDSDLDATGNGYGFNISALMKPNEQLQIGFSYKSEVKIDYEGDASFSFSPSGIPILDGTAGAIFTNQTGSTSITMPQMFVVGAMFRPGEATSVEVDLQWSGWSSYDKLNIKLTNPLLNTVDLNNWNDVWTFRVGGEQMLSPNLALRAGFIYDQTPIPDATLKPILPDASRTEITAGFGYDTHGAMVLDFAIQYLWFDYRTSTFPLFPSSYESTAMIIGFGLTYRF